MLKVGYLVPEFPSQTHAFFWREAKALEAMGHEIVWLSTRRPPRDQCRHDFADEAHQSTHYLFPPEPADIVDFLSRPKSVVVPLRYARQAASKNWPVLLPLVVAAARLARIVRQRGIQHLHAHSCANAAHSVALASGLTAVPYSLTLHGDLDVYGDQHELKMKGAKFVSPVSIPLKAELSERVGLSEDKTPVILMGVDTDRFCPDASATPVAGVLRLMTVARLNPTKGHEYALRAVRQLVDEGIEVDYRIVGAGPAEASIRALIDRLRLGSSVHLLGSLGEREVLTLLRRSDVFVLPSFGQGEASPVAVMEAMACGLTVVCSTIGGTPDMINDGEDGFLTPQRDESAIANRLKELTHDLELRRRIGEAARARAKVQFDYRANARLLADAMTRDR